MLVLVCGVYVGKLQTLRLHEYNSASRHVERKQGYVNVDTNKGGGRVEGGVLGCALAYSYVMLFYYSRGAYEKKLERQRCFSFTYQ